MMETATFVSKNVTTTGTVRWRYTWDVPGDLLKVTNGTGQALYAYDGAGRRVESVEGGSTWYYAYTGTEILYKHLLNMDNYEYVYASGFRIAMIVDRSGIINYYYHADALGSVRLITYFDGSVQNTDNYQPFGQDNGTPTGNNANNQATDKFTGKPYSTATGLYYKYQRWYDPSIGRFISPNLAA
jgi:RHS repeat-associated protein